MCLLCQKKSRKGEKLIDPTKITQKSKQGSGYMYLAHSLSSLVENKSLENPLVEALVNEFGDNLKFYLEANEAKWHKKC